MMQICMFSYISYIFWSIYTRICICLFFQTHFHLYLYSFCVCTEKSLKTHRWKLTRRLPLAQSRRIRKRTRIRRVFTGLATTWGRSRRPTSIRRAVSPSCSVTRRTGRVGMRRRRAAMTSRLASSRLLTGVGMAGTGSRFSRIWSLWRPFKRLLPFNCQVGFFQYMGFRVFFSFWFWS